MIIKGGFALIFAPNNNAFERVDIRVEGTRIAQIAPLIQPRANEDVLDAHNKLVLPGLVNAHYHSYSNFLKGTAWGEPLELWTLDTIALGSKMDGPAMALSAKLGIAEMLHCGVTTCLDHIPHLDKVDAIAQAYKNAGFRAAIAPMIADISDDRILPGIAERLHGSYGSATGPASFPGRERVEDLFAHWVERWHRPNGTMNVIAGINAPQRASPQAMETARILSEKYGLDVHAHLLETRWQLDAAMRPGEDPVEKLARAGLLDSRISLAHGVWLSSAQLDALREKGCRVVHNPTSNLFLGSGKANLLALIRRHIPTALGSDGSNCGTGQNMLSILRTAVLLSRLDEPDYRRWISPHEALDLATINGAAVCGWAGETGALAAGMLADIVLADAGTRSMVPTFDALTQLLMLQDRIEATDVFINGRQVMRDSILLCLDEQALRQEAAERFAAMSSDMHALIYNQSEKKRIYADVYNSQRADPSNTTILRTENQYEHE